MKFLPFALVFLFAIFSLGQFGRISFQNQIINGYWYEIVIACGFIWLFINHTLQPLRFYWKRLSLELGFVIYLLSIFVFTAFTYSLQENLAAFLYIVRLGFYGVFFLYLCYHVQKQQKKHVLLRTFDGSFLVLLGISISTSLIQYVLFPDLRIVFASGWDPHLYRVVGLFFDPPITATIFSLGVIYMVLFWKRITIPTWLKILMIVFLIGLLFFTYSRGAYAAAALTSFIVLLRIQYARYIVVILFVAVGILLIMPKKFGEGVNLLRTSTIHSRMVDYEEGIRIWQTKPITGIGYNRIRAVKTEEKTLLNQPTHSGASFHSSFLIILVTGGVVGLLVFLAIIWKAQKLSLLMKYSLFFTSIISLTDNVLLHPFILFLLFFFVVVSLEVTSKDQKSGCKN